VLVRGDCGIHSLARGLQRALGAETCRRVPGISSVQVACARFGLDWEGLRVVSAHGRDPRVLESADLRAPLVAVLGGGAGFGRTVEGLRALLGARKVCLGSDLTLESETLRVVGPGEAVPTDLPSRTVALLPRDEP
jgi:precorrin-6B methylase 1